MTNLHTVMLWQEAVREFEAYILPSVRHAEKRNNDGKSWVDGPMRREAWNNFTDALCKEGKISDWQYENWSQPASCEREPKW